MKAARCRISGIGELVKEWKRSPGLSTGGVWVESRGGALVVRGGGSSWAILVFWPRSEKGRLVSHGLGAVRGAVREAVWEAVRGAVRGASLDRTASADRLEANRGDHDMNWEKDRVAGEFDGLDKAALRHLREVFVAA